MVEVDMSAEIEASQVELENESRRKFNAEVEDMVKRFKGYVEKGECNGLQMRTPEKAYSENRSANAWIKSEQRRKIARMNDDLKEEITYRKLQIRNAKETLKNMRATSREAHKISYNHERAVQLEACKILGIRFSVGGNEVLAATRKI